MDADKMTRAELIDFIVSRTTVLATALSDWSTDHLRFMVRERISDEQEWDANNKAL